MDEHGRSERRRHVPDVLEREQRRLPTDRLETAPAAVGPDGEPLEGFAPATPDSGYWKGLDSGHRRALLLAIASGVLGVAVLAGVAFYLVTLREPQAPSRRPASSVVPSEEPSRAAETSGSAGTTGSVESSATTATPGIPAARRAPLLAYRAGGTIWVSGEHGGNPRSVYPGADGLFALSPNGLTLAYMDAAIGNLRIVDVTTGRTALVGEAVAVRPEWSPDSSFLVYTRPVAGGHAEEVARVEANGTGARELMEGWRGRVLADGSTVVAAPAPTPGGSVALAVFSDGRRLAAASRMHVTEVCPAQGGFYYADAGGLTGAGGVTSVPSLQWARYDGTGARVLVGRPAASAAAAFSDLYLSPDGSWLVYAETGDDGYSRLFALRTAGGKPVALTPRLDGYFMGWSADGKELFLTEGNAVQGEPTRVSAVRPDGSGHRIIVEGGGL